MSGRSPLLTVDDVRGWLRVTQSERTQEEARTRALITHHALTAFVAHASWGLSQQAAGDEVWRTRGTHAPEHVKQIVAEALEGVGWTRPTRKAIGD
jgi:hypothetical protein